jgi:hypothetical protein
MRHGFQQTKQLFDNTDMKYMKLTHTVIRLVSLVLNLAFVPSWV